MLLTQRAQRPEVRGSCFPARLALDRELHAADDEVDLETGTRPPIAQRTVEPVVGQVGAQLVAQEVLERPAEAIGTCSDDLPFRIQLVGNADAAAEEVTGSALEIPRAGSARSNFGDRSDRC
jgi:hypothetical protein